MSNVIVNVSELRSLIQDIRRSGMDYVEVSISDEEEFDGDIIPASLNLIGYRKSNPDVSVAFEPLDAVEDASEIAEKLLHSTQMSSNLL